MFSVFNGLQMAIGSLPYGIRMLTETHVVLRRVQVSLVVSLATQLVRGTVRIPLSSVTCASANGDLTG